MMWPRSLNQNLEVARSVSALLDGALRQQHVDKLEVLLLVAAAIITMPRDLDARARLLSLCQGRLTDLVRDMNAVLARRAEAPPPTKQH